MARKTFTPEEKEAYKEAKQRQREELEARVKDLVDSFRDSDTFKSYLSQMGEFNRNCGQYLHRYSPNNLLFIVMQDPTASIVGSAGAWRRMGRHVSKGETSRIQVWAPMREAVMRDKLDENGKPVLKPDGTPEREPERDENGRVKRRFNGRFKLEPVFDVSQTDGDPLPELARELKNPVESFTDYEKAVREASPFPVFYSDEPEAAGIPLGGAKGVCSYTDRKIVVKAGMSEEQTLKTMIHEVVHARLHDPAALSVERGEDMPGLSRNEKEVQAECTAFLVCEHFGLDTSDYSIPYIMSWGQDEKLTPLTRSLDAILGASDEIIDLMETHLWVDMGIDETLEGRQHAEPVTPAAGETSPERTELDRVLANKTVAALWEAGFKVRYMEPLSADEAPSVTLERKTEEGRVRIDALLFRDGEGFLVPNFDEPGTTTVSAFATGSKEPYFRDGTGNLVDQMRELNAENERRERSLGADSRNAGELAGDPIAVKLAAAGYTCEPREIMTPEGYASGLSFTKDNGTYAIHVDLVPSSSPLEGGAVDVVHQHRTALTAIDKSKGGETFFEAWFDAPIGDQMAALRGNERYRSLSAAEPVANPVAHVKQKRSQAAPPRNLASLQAAHRAKPRHGDLAR